MTYYTGPKTLRNKLNEWFAKQNHIKLPKNAISKLYVSVADAWTPAKLFPTGTEEGLFLDFSDISTLYTDQTFATNISAIGDPVGGVIDKSQGLVLGVERLTNGGFDTDLTGWTAAAGFSVSGGKLIGATSGDKIYQAAGITAGEVYSFTITGVVGEWGVRLGQDATNDYTITADGTYFITPGTLYSTTDFRLRVNIAGSELASISVKKLPGNHLKQATSTARPIWTRHPKSGVRNLLDASEDFSNVVWSGTVASVTANVATAPNGSPADRVNISVSTSQRFQSLTLKASTTYTQKVWVKKDDGVAGRINMTIYGASFIGQAFFDYDTSGVFTTAGLTGTASNQSVTDGGNGWYLIQASYSTGANTAITNRFYPNTLGSTDSLLMSSMQLEEGSTATAYQTRVSKYNVTEAGVADCYGLTFDGVDDYMQTAANLDLSGTDAITVCLGEYMLSGKQLTIEQGTSGASGFKFGAWDNTNNARFIRYDTTNKTSQYSSISKPTYAVITGGNVDAANQMFRWNGSVIDTGPTALGALPSDIARIGGATNPLSQGTIYGVTLTDYILDAEQLAALEEWTAARTPEVTLA